MGGEGVAGEGEAVKNAWIVFVSRAEAAMIAGGVAPAKIASRLTELANAHCKIEHDIREAREFRQCCERAAELSHAVGSIEAGKRLGVPDRTIRDRRDHWLKSRHPTGGS